MRRVERTVPGTALGRCAGDLRGAARCSAGFTVTELLVVIAILALVVGIVAVALKPITVKSRASVCASNQRQIVLACMSYAADQKQRLPSPRTDNGGVGYNYTACTPVYNPPHTNYTVTWPWVAAYGANVSGGIEKTTALEKGKIWPYIGSIKVFKSPLDPVKRLRSYSLSAFVGVSHADELADYDNFASGLGIPLCSFDTRTLARIRVPSKTLYCLPEDDSVGPNNQGWIISPVTSKWIDWPATWNPDHIPIAYCDGSFEVYGFQKPKIENSMETFGHNWTEVPIATAFDWKWFQLRLLPGIIPGT